MREVCHAAEVPHVDEGVCGEGGGVVRAAEHHGHDVVLQRLEHLLRDVVRAHGVLQSQVELVAPLKLPPTLRPEVLLITQHSYYMINTK